MDSQTRRLIERYFYDYGASGRLVSGRELEIIEANLTAAYGQLVKESRIKNPTEEKVMQLLNLTNTSDASWYSVIDSVFSAYKYLRPDIYEVMQDKYIYCKPNSEICKYIHRNTLSAWRNKWLETAYEIAKDRGIIRQSKKTNAQKPCANTY